VVGNADGRGLEGDLSLGGLRSVVIFEGPVGTGRLFLGGLFAVGMGGRADVGGPKTGGDRYGRGDAIVADITLQSSRGRPGSAGHGASSYQLGRSWFVLVVFAFAQGRVVL
jgi:hypothetical protein